MDVLHAVFCKLLKSKVISKLTYFSVVPAAITRITYLPKASKSGDLTLDAWPTALCALIVESLSIIVACIPYLKPFLDSLESGMMNNDKLRREGMSDLYGRSRTKATCSPDANGRSRENISAGTGQYIELGSIPDVNRGVTSSPDTASRCVIDAPKIHGPSSLTDREWDAESQQSQSKFIRKTTSLTLTNTPRALDGML